MSQQQPKPSNLDTIPSVIGDELCKNRGESLQYSNQDSKNNAPSPTSYEIYNESNSGGPKTGADIVTLDESPTRKRTSIGVKNKDEGGNRQSSKDPENLSLERLEAEIETLLIYTKAVKWPTLKQTLTEGRFLLRVFQLVFGLGAFLDIGYTSLINNYTSVVLESSGIPFYCFTSITSIFVSVSNLFLYSFPGFLGIPPHRHQRVSRVETSFDAIICVLWIVATAQLATYGKCPSQSTQMIGSIIIYLDISTKYCPTLQATLFLGGITGMLFLWRFVDGIKDQRRHKGNGQNMGQHIMFARGSWKD